MEDKPPLSLLATLDHVLRGTFLHQDELARGRIEVPTRRLVGLGLGLGALYGLALGSYGALRGADQAGMQILASALKVPLLFLLTLVVTFPSLYVFAALQRLPLDFRGTLRLLLIAILVHLAVIASLGPVFAFFAASTKSYAFMLLLNVAFFAIGGLLGFAMLRRATHGMFLAGAAEPPPPARADSEASATSTPPLLGTHRAHRGAEQARRMLRTWCIVYGAVGAQMGWLLRPFLGSPDLPFTMFRPREDNFFVGVMRALRALFAG
jgi:hypothetical protein